VWIDGFKVQVTAVLTDRDLDSLWQELRDLPFPERVISEDFRGPQYTATPARSDSDRGR
jgi:hypothetical protein